ncbi:MAG: mercuric reductase [Betaproteobacteria bacterium]|nr:mercuric reductase [Betaproteobacteria bacterium]
MESSEKFDAIIIGSGQAGKPLALALSRAGWNTALIEREHVGGTCINVGCTPTKTMAASARVAYLARRAADYGVRVPGVEVDQAAVRARKRAIVERFRNYGTKTLKGTANLALLFGAASFVDAKTVEVRLNDGGGQRLTAPKIVINTGGRPFVPPIAGLSSVPYLDSTSVMELERVPEHLIVIGGGYVGLEFGQMYRRFGAEVTIVERDARLVGREDPDVSEAVRKILEEDGIRIDTDSAVDRVERDAAGAITVRYACEGCERSVTGSHLLVAIGRRPNTEELRLEAAGVALDARGFASVDATLQTNVPGIFAAGDVKGGPAFTHISYDDYRILRDRWLKNLDARVGDRLVPNTTFIDPQLAQVGLTETEARKRGLDIRVAKLPMSGVARALEVGESRGLMKVIVDAKTDQILGCVVLGIEGGEIMSMVQIAMMGRLPYTVLKEAIFAHPTLAEGLNNVFLALDA